MSVPRVLVIGGSYFAGRVFATLASREMELTLINRGRYSMAHLPNLKEYRCDRRDEAGLRRLPLESYDAVVDFCAYAPGDIETLFRGLGAEFRRYIFISTADVYDRASPRPWSEATPLGTRFPPEAADYLGGKVALERECAEACARRGVAGTALRPAFLYGPYNYAPRESWYIQRVVKGEEIPQPTDARGQFQFIYVKDLAEAVMACIRRGSDPGPAYNLAAPEVLDYPGFLSALRSASELPVKTRSVTVSEVLGENIPLPFPLTEADSELFDGSLAARELGIAYTPFREGMEKTWRAFRPVYEGRP